jgi:hypothetical protein
MFGRKSSTDVRPNWEIKIFKDNEMNNLVKLLLVLIAIFCTNVAASAQQKSLVGNIKNSSSVDGCGCYSSFTKADSNASRHIFFASGEGNGEEALMNINGRDVKLPLVSETNPKGKVKLGSRYTSRYQSGDTTVDVVKIVTWLCPPNDESCEVARFRVTLTIKKGNRSQVVQAVGECGC